MRFRLIVSTLTLALFVLWPAAMPTLQAQATINGTYLSSAVTTAANRVIVASASTIAVGQILFVDREAMEVTSITSTTIGVRRGGYGTAAAAHASGGYVFTGPANYFGAGNEAPAGACTTTNETALPKVNLASGDVYQCTNSTWVRYRQGGLPAFTPGTPASYTASGAITVAPGISLLSVTGAGAMTLVAPSRLQDGMVMEITSTTAQAHTITITAGFNGGGSDVDVCTLGGAIGNGVIIRAYQGNWYLIAARACTLG